MNFKNIFISIFLSILGVGCSLEPGEKEGRLRILADLKSSSPLDLYESFSGDFQAFSGPPSTLSEFDCIGLNVTGPGIPPSDFKPGSQPEIEFEQAWNLGKSCNYPGKFSNFARNVSTGSQKSFSVEVPSGPRRLVQVVGIKDVGSTGQVCSFFDQGRIPPPEFQVEPYELGRVRIDQLQSSQSFSISSFWDSLPETIKQSRFFDCQNCPPVVGQEAQDGSVVKLAPYVASISYEKWAQKFVLSQSISISEFKLLLSKETATSDQVIKVGIFSDTGAGDPQSPLTSPLMIHYSELSLVPKILKRKFPTGVFLSAGTDYWLVVERDVSSGSNGSTQIHANSVSSYQQIRRHNGSTWEPHVGGWDMQFTLFSNCQP